MGINSPKGPGDPQGDVNIHELTRFIEENRNTDGFSNLATMGDDNIRRLKGILHLKSDATPQEIGKAFRDAIDNALQSAQIEGLPVAKDIDSTRLNLHIAKLAEQKPEVEKTCANSEIKEERTFSKQDILKLIALFAMTNKLELDELKISKIINNEQGTLLVLEVQSPNPNSDGGYQQISYMIKGKHENNQSGTTAIDRTFWDKDDMPEGGDIVAEYSEGKWVFKS
jgi:hypothetical protein